MKLYKDQIIQSTNPDKQGERFTKEDLSSFIKVIEHKRIPVNQNHNPADPIVGYFENARMIEDQDSPGNYFIIADVYCDPSKFTQIMGGFSFGGVRGMYANDDDPAFAIYFPFPLYNDVNYLKSYLDIDVPLTVGKNVKKAADPITVAIIVALGQLILTPFWQTIYDKTIAPYIDKILDSNKLDTNLSYDVVINCTDELEHEFKAYFINGDNKLRSIRGYIIKSGISKAYDFITNDEKAKQVGLAMAHLTYNKDFNRYDLYRVTYKDGNVLEF